MQYFRQLAVIAMAFFVLFVLGCKSPEAVQETPAAVPESRAPVTPPASEAGLGTVVTAVVVAVDSISGTHGPCAMAPCGATIRIERIERRGREFGDALTEGAEVPVHFAFTLNETTTALFPNMDAHYPGLSEGSRFQAEITTRLGSGTLLRHAVYHYIVIH